MSIGDKIKQHRESRNLTQADIGSILHVSTQAISKWERNISEPDFETVRNLAKYFGIPVSEMLDESNLKDIDNKKTLNENGKNFKHNKKLLIGIISVVCVIILVTSLIFTIIKIKEHYKITSSVYTIVFQNDDGTIISKNPNYHYGDKVQVPEQNPTKPSDEYNSYTFVGYDKAIENVTGNATYTAVYTATPIQYIIIFKNYDGQILLQKNDYHYGDTVITPSEDPTKPEEGRASFVFIGWDSAVSPVTGNKTYTAVYRTVYEPSKGLVYSIVGEGEDSYYSVSGIGDCQDQIIVIKDTYDNKPVKEIAESAFSNNKNITSIEIPSGITKIGNSAFNFCSNLESVTLPDTLENIGNNAFFFCKKLKTVEFPNTLKTIGENAFVWCESISNIFIPKSVETIGNSAFSFCKGVTSLIFEAETNLTIINNQSFSNLTALSEVEIPNGITTLDYQSFTGCSSIQKLTLPISMTQFGNNVFDGWTSLKNVYYNGNVNTWLNISFASINTNPMEKAQHIFFNNNGNYEEIETLEVPNGITSIKKQSFNGCTSIKNIILPSSLTTINSNAFMNCTIEKIYFKGSDSDWNAIKINSGNDCLTAATIIYNYE